LINTACSDIDGLAEMLRIAWRSDPMPSNHTAPGCMLRFDVRGDGHGSSVSLGFTYADVTSQDPVAVHNGAAYFTDSKLAFKVGPHLFPDTTMLRVQF
jgi:hypothetical protein